MSFFKSCSAIISSETNTSSPQELLLQYDSDEDGSITFEELKEAVEKAYLAVKKNLVLHGFCGIGEERPFNPSIRVESG